MDVKQRKTDYFNREKFNMYCRFRYKNLIWYIYIGLKEKLYYNMSDVNTTFYHLLEEHLTKEYVKSKTMVIQEGKRSRKFNIESIEPCTIKTISKKDFQFVLDNSPNIKAEMEKRYEEILNQCPDIIMRVPQHYIASYLGITKVHLSRIKSKLARKK